MTWPPVLTFLGRFQGAVELDLIANSAIDDSIIVNARTRVCNGNSLLTIRGQFRQLTPTRSVDNDDEALVHIQADFTVEDLALSVVFANTELSVVQLKISRYLIIKMQAFAGRRNFPISTALFHDVLKNKVQVLFRVA
ncbi:hypothetical protein D3C80_1549080 [compost metagenome]